MLSNLYKETARRPLNLLSYFIRRRKYCSAEPQFFSSIKNFDLSNFFKEEEIGFFPETYVYFSSSAALHSSTSWRTAMFVRIR